MRLSNSRLILIKFGALIGVLSQLLWLLANGWDEALVRLPLGLIAGGLAFGLLGELAAALFRLKGRDFWIDLGHFKSFLGKPLAIKIISAAFLVFVAGVLYGWVAYSGKICPYSIMKETEDFLFGDHRLSLFEKLANDLDLTPYRHLVKYKTNPSQGRHFRELEGLPLAPERKKPLVYFSPQAPKGFRLIQGAFCFQDNRFGVILLNPNGRVVRTWKISQDDVPWESRSDANVFCHGLAISPDGSLYIGFDLGSALLKYDWCGNLVWRLPGSFDHSIAFEDASSFWVWGNGGPTQPSGSRMVKVDAKTGKILKSINLDQVMDANPDIDIMGIRQLDGETKSDWVGHGGGPWHPNDVEPLTAELASHYPGFQAGDLLVCLRSLNLIFVMDQKNLRIKWWRQGVARRPHDPDWNTRGTITIYNNNMHRGYSSIVELDPRNYESKVLVQGQAYNFYSPIRGKHQLLPNGDILITSSQQGRVFELDKTGKVTFEFINRFNEDHHNLLVSEAVFLPQNYFKDLPQCN